MKDIIISKLRELEEKENISILLAVESGSRAWGFESPDSDYDVRFIYVRQLEDYLRLDEPRDVIELPIEGDLDINGWDLKKALKLLYKSNPTLAEWLTSPVVYLKTDYGDRLKELAYMYYIKKGALYHYVSMAESNYREFLTKGDEVKLKKYFYVLRPVLACRFIMERWSIPPMRFEKLVEMELTEELRPEVQRLLDLKVNSPEVKTIPRVDVLNDYLETSIAGIKALIAEYPEEEYGDWEALDWFFRAVLRGEKIRSYEDEKYE